MSGCIVVLENGAGHVSESQQIYPSNPAIEHTANADMCQTLLLADDGFRHNKRAPLWSPRFCASIKAVVRFNFEGVAHPICSAQ